MKLFKFSVTLFTILSASACMSLKKPLCTDHNLVAFEGLEGTYTFEAMGEKMFARYTKLETGLYMEDIWTELEPEVSGSKIKICEVNGAIYSSTLPNDEFGTYSIREFETTDKGLKFRVLTIDESFLKANKIPYVVKNAALDGGKTYIVDNSKLSPEAWLKGVYTAHEFLFVRQ